MSGGHEGVVVHRAAPGPDAIDEYARRLVAALAAGGHAVRYEPRGLGPVRAAPVAPAWVLLQYNPFAYGRAGVAPALVRDARALRRGANVPLGVLVHEAWIDVRDARSAVIGGWQRAQLRTLLRLADVVLASTEALATELGDGAVHVPIATTVTPVAMTPAAARAAVAPSARLVVGLFGRANPSRALGYAEAAIAAIAGAQGAAGLTVLNLGAGAPEIRVPGGVDVRTPGELDAAELSRHLWATDLLLLPFTDGVSTHRTTLMAALAHARPVLGLHGHNTDGVLAAQPGALVLTPTGDPRAFAAAAVALADDERRRAAIGAAGRALYHERFDWPVVARRVSDVLGALAPATEIRWAA